jgi:hypothetical protein
MSGSQLLGAAGTTFLCLMIVKWDSRIDRSHRQD